MTGNPSHAARRLAVFLICGTALVGCDDFFGSQPISQQAAIEDRQPDANGVIRYDGFSVMVARDGDTIGSMAGRVGLTDVVLARYNGLPTTYILRPGERLALPDDAQVAAVSSGWTPEVVTGVLDDLPDDTPAAAPPANAPGVQLTRHRVERGETAFSIARLYGVSVTALASWNGLGGDLEVTPGRSLIIPPGDAGTQPPQAEREPEPVPEQTQPPQDTAAISDPGTTTNVPPPPSADQPLPDNITATVEPPESPNLGGAATGDRTRFLTPVAGTIVKGYSREPGRNKNEGLDFETAANAAVKAAEDGEVALVSRSLGGLGTIVLIRHRDDIMTVYGRVKDVTVEKGQRVTRGQRIGAVADASPPIFHFEIRRGTQSIDPAPFL